MFLLVLVILFLTASTLHPQPQPQLSALPSPTQTGTPWPRLTLKPLPVPKRQTLKNVCLVNGGDYGRAINECQKGARVEIVVRGNGELLTPAIIEPNNILTISANTTIRPATEAIPFRLKQGATIRGSGWTSVIRESSYPKQWGVVGRYHGSLANEARDERLTIRDLKIQGFDGKPFNSAPQALDLGNCVDCLVENVWLNETHSIGLQYGGAGFKGNYALRSVARHILFTQVASQSLACVNCDQVTFEDIWVIDPGQAGGPGNTSIDFEPNGERDRNTNNTLRRFHIDHRGSVQSTTGNGVVVQASATKLAGNVLVENGVIIGGRSGWEAEVTNKLSNALYVFGISNVTIRNVKVSRTGQTCIYLDGPSNVTLENILCEDVGGGGVPGFIAYVNGKNIFRDIVFRYSGRGPVSSALMLKGDPVMQGVVGWTIERQN
jgi:hypothetical protein